MSEREYSKRNRKRRGVNESALEKFKRSRDSKTRGIDRVEVNVFKQENAFEQVLYATSINPYTFRMKKMCMNM